MQKPYTDAVKYQHRAGLQFDPYKKMLPGKRPKAWLTLSIRSSFLECINSLLLSPQYVYKTTKI